MPEYPFPPPPAISWQSLVIQVTLCALLVLAVAAIVHCVRRRPSGNVVATWLVGFALITVMFVPTVSSVDRFALGLVGLWILMGVGSAISLVRWKLAKTASAPDLLVASVVFLSLVLAPCLFLNSLPSTPYEVHWRRQCKNNLKQIGMAIQTYHDNFDSFPTGPLLAHPRSWRVELLPFLEREPLYRRYHADEEWNSAHNMSLQSERPLEYVCPTAMNKDLGADMPIMTSYVALAGSGATYDSENPALTFSKVTDGASNTLGVVEACGLRRIWTDPRDADLDRLPMAINRPGHQPGNSDGTLSSYHREGAHVLMLDGSVFFLAEGMDPRVLHALATPRGGETDVEF